MLSRDEFTTPYLEYLLRPNPDVPGNELFGPVRGLAGLRSGIDPVAHGSSRRTPDRSASVESTRALVAAR